MNVATSSPALAMAYVFILLWILMDVRWKGFSRWQKTFIPLFVVFLAVFNHLLRTYIGPSAYGKLIFLTMHIPYFLIFKSITKCSIMKMTFMIFSAVIFTSPVIFIGNFVKEAIKISLWSELLSNLISYAIMLLIAQFVFRRGFNYLLKYGDDRFFWRNSLIPVLYYVYLFAAMNQDFSSLHSAAGYMIRLLPTIYVFAFYALLMRNYKELNEKKNYEATQATLNQQLISAKEQLELLNSSQTQTAIYQHDMRHHLTIIGGFLSVGNQNEAETYIKNVENDIDKITPTRFCENELVNLLCSSFSKRAEQNGIQFKVEVKLPGKLSVSDTELCALLSNGLENALNASSKLNDSPKWTEFFCDVRTNKLLIEINNSYGGEVEMQDGLPISSQSGHGYGCRSIKSIVEQNGGFCTFNAVGGVFTLRIMLPLPGCVEHK